jgi:hypothetical protein
MACLWGSFFSVNFLRFDEFGYESHKLVEGRGKISKGNIEDIGQETRSGEQVAPDIKDLIDATDGFQ